ncbi:MAG: DNA-directed RNA polymerase subunit omega [bacterium]|nr:DNA-directed RNA polymerase subunit omega [bacterium]
MHILYSYNTEKVFENDENDYLTILAIAVRAREIADNYPEYEKMLENNKPTTLALSEYLQDCFDFDYEEIDE